jgi:hypothetical protein
VISGLFTLAGIIIVLKWLDWAFYFDHWHNVAGILFMGLCELLVLGGISAICLRRFVNMEWRTHLLLKMTNVPVTMGVELSPHGQSGTDTW